MKKIFTLVIGLVLTVAIFATDHRPTVTVSALKKYEVVIDGKRYLGNYGNTISISNISNGRHSVKVYEVRKGFFMKSKRLVSSSAFRLRNSDLHIKVDRFGQLQITELRNGRDWNDRRNDNDRDYRHDRDRDRRF